MWNKFGNWRRSRDCLLKCRGLETDTRWNITPGHIPGFETDSGEHFPDYDGLIAYTRDLPEDQSGVLALESHGALTTD